MLLGCYAARLFEIYRCQAAPVAFIVRQTQAGLYDMLVNFCQLIMYHIIKRRLFKSFRTGFTPYTMFLWYILLLLYRWGAEKAPWVAAECTANAPCVYDVYMIICAVCELNCFVLVIHNTFNSRGSLGATLQRYRLDIDDLWVIQTWQFSQAAEKVLGFALAFCTSELRWKTSETSI